MDPLTIIVYDRNVKHTLGDSSQSTSHRTPDANSHAMFPTNIKYVFEDDDAILTIVDAENNESVENILILNLDDSGALEGVELISDHFQILSYKGIANGNDQVVDDVELEVVSEFADLSVLARDLPLDELIKLYVIQNEQMQTISNSM
ncbi:CIS1 (YDR022C) [Zygosaccharomyces parabailii]|nr:CIS1 (YDR022C) [Zygosaccharomyces parabailii]CDH16155.1 related to Autophagy-related protein 31 [Zygosaccharomyces bailii ISA1307]